MQAAVARPDAKSDIDNCLKPIIDAVTGPDGLLADYDPASGHVSTHLCLPAFSAAWRGRRDPSMLSAADSPAASPAPPSGITCPTVHVEDVIFVEVS